MLDKKAKELIRNEDVRDIRLAYLNKIKSALILINDPSYTVKEKNYKTIEIYINHNNIGNIQYSIISSGSRSKTLFLYNIKIEEEFNGEGIQRML